MNGDTIEIYRFLYAVENTRVPEGGYFRNFGLGMCHWDPGTLSLYLS